MQANLDREIICYMLDYFYDRKQKGYVNHFEYQSLSFDNLQKVHVLHFDK